MDQTSVSTTVLRHLWRPASDRAQQRRSLFPLGAQTDLQLHCIHKFIRVRLGRLSFSPLAASEAGHVSCYNSQRDDELPCSCTPYHLLMRGVRCCF